ncbi:hypothetical protein BJF83_14880 [Nocardiopsis sp. CNR-923]|nr:hypothetical protein BJF83_14880 [Nocardiopsis sp. CNR-923]
MDVAELGDDEGLALLDLAEEPCDHEDQGEEDDGSDGQGDADVRKAALVASCPVVVALDSTWGLSLCAWGGVTATGAGAGHAAGTASGASR